MEGVNVLKITLYKSKFDWNETVEKINSLLQEENPQNKVYSEFDQFEIANWDEKTKDTKIFVKPFLKKKTKRPVRWQILLNSLISKNSNQDIVDFMPNEILTFDSLILLKQNSSINSNVYFFAFGQSYHDMYDFVDFDFGIDFGERTIKKEDVITKNVNFFQQNKLKEITNYRRNNFAFAKASESYSSISGRPQDTTRFGTTINCGTGVSLNIASSEAEFEKNICTLIPNIDELITRGRVLNEFPRLEILKDGEKINILDVLLLNAIIDPIDTSINSVDLSLFFEFKNTVVMLDEIPTVNLFIKSQKNKTKTSLYNEEDSYIGTIKNFLINYAVNDINLVMIEIIDSDSISQSFELKRVLHGEVDDNGTHYLLQNGNWGTFNREYFDLLNSYLDEIEVKLNSLHPESLNFQGDEESYIQAVYNHDPNMYKILHKKFIKPTNPAFVVKGNGIELADLFNVSTNELIAVKKGIKTALSLYSLEQSMMSINSINHLPSFNLTDIQNVLNLNEINELKYARRTSVIWMLPLNSSNNEPVSDITHTRNVQSETFDLKQLGSILLKNKLVEWAEFSKDNKLRPTIYMECPHDESK